MTNHESARGGEFTTPGVQAERTESTAEKLYKERFVTAADQLFDAVQGACERLPWHKLIPGYSKLTHLNRQITVEGEILHPFLGNHDDFFMGDTTTIVLQRFQHVHTDTVLMLLVSDRTQSTLHSLRATIQREVVASERWYAADVVENQWVLDNEATQQALSDDLFQPSPGHRLNMGSARYTVPNRQLGKTELTQAGSGVFLLQVLVKLAGLIDLNVKVQDNVRYGQLR